MAIALQRLSPRHFLLALEAKGGRAEGAMHRRVRMAYLKRSMGAIPGDLRSREARKAPTAEITISGYSTMA